MHAILDRLPTPDSLYAARGKIGGLVAGIVGTWVLVLFAQVAYTGQGIGENPAPVEQVYFFE